MKVTEKETENNPALLDFITRRMISKPNSYQGQRSIKM